MGQRANERAGSEPTAAAAFLSLCCLAPRTVRKPRLPQVIVQLGAFVEDAAEELPGRRELENPNPFW